MIAVDASGIWQLGTERSDAQFSDFLSWRALSSYRAIVFGGEIVFEAQFQLARSNSRPWPPLFAASDPPSRAPSGSTLTRSLVDNHNSANNNGALCFQ